MGNPFIDNSGKLLTLVSKHVSDTGIDALDRYKQRGKEQHEAFIQNKDKLWFYYPVKKNCFVIFETSKLTLKTPMTSVLNKTMLFFLTYSMFVKAGNWI